MTDVLIFACLCTAAYYLVARAQLTRWLWQPLDGVRFIGPLLRCPACCGTWLGAGVGWYWHPVPMRSPVEFTVTCALLGMVCTALTWGAMKWALDVGSVHDEG